jgi:hypothetical protein
MYHGHGAVFAAQAASDACFCIDGHDAVRCLCDGTHRADLHAVSIVTLAAHHGQVIQVFGFRVDGQPGPPGIVSAGHGQAACQLTDAAPGASVKKDMDESVDGGFSFQFNGSRIMINEKITHIMYYVKIFFLDFIPQAWYDRD